MSDRKRVRELIVVEGKCDVSAVKAAVDCDVIETKGFGIFHAEGLDAQIRRLAGDRGIIILTDSDRAGFRIRNRLKSALGDLNPKQAYIPEIPGKERRKASPSADGFLGVEAMSADILLEALRQAGATFEDADAPGRRGGLTKADFYAMGLSGGAGSAEKRARLLARMGLPRGITANAFLELVNISFTREEFIAFLEQQP